MLSRKLWWHLLARLHNPTYATRALGVTIGDGCRIFTSNFGSEPWLITLGDRVTISQGVLLLTHDGATCLVRDERGRRFRYARIVIGSDVFLGTNSIIMPGVRIGDRVIVGAGSVVTKSVPSGTVVAGNPARFVCSFDDYAAKVLVLPSERDLTGSTLQERILGITEQSARPEMITPSVGAGDSP